MYFALYIVFCLITFLIIAQASRFEKHPLETWDGDDWFLFVLFCFLPMFNVVLILISMLTMCKFRQPKIINYLVKERK